jgi:hypothetical protein
MNPFTRRTIAVAVLGLALSTPNLTAAPIFKTYSTEADLLAALPPGTLPEDVVVAIAEFGDDVIPGPPFDGDFGVGYEGAGTVIEVPDLPPSAGSESYWVTTGTTTFSLAPGALADSANGFLISYLERPGVPLPSVNVTMANGRHYYVAPLAGGPFEHPGELFFAFSSTEPFTAVSVAGGDAELWTQFVGFYNVPVPEAATGLLLGVGLLLASGARRLRRF